MTFNSSNWRRRWGRARWRVILPLTLAAWLVVLAVMLGMIQHFSTTERAQAADVIVVLGSGLRRDNQPGPAMIRRTDKAAQLYLAGYAPVVICSGGFPAGRTRSEADACAELLREDGVPAAAIVLEERSRSTEENALYTHEIMQARGWRTALVVSDGYHLFRAQRLFTLAGIAALTSPAPPPPRGQLVSAMGREVVALHWQLFKEFFRLPVTYVPVL